MARSRLVLAVLLLSGCNWYYNTLPSPDDLMAAIPWFDHMITSRAVHPYGRADLPRNTVPGTVPITGGEADWSREFLSGNSATADRLVNPTLGDSAGIVGSTIRGDTLYQTFCALCHGSLGAGDGTVGPRMGAPALLTARARAFSDGYLYSIVRYGRGLMPRYGDKVYRREDRWDIVNYLRKLQGTGGAAVSPSSRTSPPSPSPPR